MAQLARFARSGSAARSALALVGRPHAWPSDRRYPGLAHGWHGAAWVALQRARAGAAVPDRVFAVIGRRLVGESGHPPRTDHVAAFVGGAADAVVAAHAARYGIARKAVVLSVCRRAASVAAECRSWDVYLGLAGVLLALAEVAAIEPGALRDVRPDRLAARLVAQVDALCARPPRGWQTGMAHGPAGAIMALESCAALGWCRIAKPRRQRWLDALAASAVTGADGAVFWPAIAGQRDLGLQSWCAGTPGIALAMLQCFRLTREPVYLEVSCAALAGMTALARRPVASPTVCCGSAGYGHIFVEAYRVTGEAGWLAHASRASQLAPAVAAAPRRGLMQGELGVAYLADRLATPLGLALPGLGASSA